MNWDPVYVWLVNEFVNFGVRWVVVAVASLVFGVVLIGPRYKAMKRDIAALNEDRGTTFQNVIHNHALVDGDVDEIRVMSQSEYDALPVKKEKTMYLILSRGQ